jgi:uncharacterized protein (TIGR02118 family)
MPGASQPAVSLVVLWTKPQDAAAFDRDYTEQHVPLIWQLPGLIEARTATLRSPTHHRMAEMLFASRDELKAALGSPGGRALADDAQRLEKTFAVTAESHIATAEPSARPS